MSEFALFEVGKLQVFCSIEWRCLMSEGIRGFGCSISCILTHPFLVGEYGRKMKITYIPNAIAFSVWRQDNFEVYSKSEPSNNALVTWLKDLQPEARRGCFCNRWLVSLCFEETCSSKNLVNTCWNSIFFISISMFQLVVSHPPGDRAIFHQLRRGSSMVNVLSPQSFMEGVFPTQDPQCWTMR